MAIIVVVSFFLHLTAAPARSQMGFILGLGTGILFSGGGNQESSVNILYTLTDVSKRVKDPLGVRLASVAVNYSSRGMGDNGRRRTLQELFSKEVGDSKKYEILQIVRVFAGTAATIWFAYIEKESVLPPLAQK